MRDCSTDTAPNGSAMMVEEAQRAMLGVGRPVRLSSESMARGLRVTFFPVKSVTPRVREFAGRLREVLAACGVDIVEYEDALTGGKNAKIREDIVIIAAGELENGNLPVDHVSNLRRTTIVGIVDGPCPAVGETDLQARLNSIVQALGWSLVQVAIYVDEQSWTICTMNGAIIPCPDPCTFASDVHSTLIPKLAAPVVPPHSSDFDSHEGTLDLSSPEYRPYVEDFIESGPLWEQTGLMLFHTSMQSLSFRDTFYKRVAAAYLDQRSGMSYGFLARQMATPPTKVYSSVEATRLLGSSGWMDRGSVRIGGKLHVACRLGGAAFLVEVPDVRVLSTRSGCDKSHIDGHRDLLLMTLADGRISIETPAVANGVFDSKPSYDTLTILAHGLGNAIAATLQSHLDPRAEFLHTLQGNGMALAHWHGDLDRSVLPAGYSVYGADNPPVSCSTHQAAIFALAGKLSAFRRSFEEGRTFVGDLHVEPHHGVNVTWRTLTDLARTLLLKNGLPHSARPTLAPAEQSLRR